MFETACLPIIIAEIGGLILENGKETKNVDEKSWISATATS